MQTSDRIGKPEKFNIQVESPVYDSFRAAKVRSMFNVSEDQGSRHEVRVDLPLNEQDWKIGAVIGPSGTGKTTLGRHLFGGGKLHQGFEWDAEKPIIDQIGADLDFTKVTGALASVGLGTVPSWLRPYQVLSMGEKFRADMARIVIEQPEAIVIDEFTSVVDRQIAQIGAAAFSKAWRRTQGQVVVLACHYDIIDWLQPDWVLDTRYWDFHWRCLRRRPEIALDIYESGSSAAWKFFKPHHYLDLPNPVAPSYYVAECDGVPVAHVCVSTGPGLKVARITRLVVMPEWQGAGVGTKFLEYVAQRWLDGENRYKKKMTGIIHTSHPGLSFALNRSKRWVATRQMMGGSDKKKSIRSILKAGRSKTSKFGTWASSSEKRDTGTSGYGGHFRAVAAFRYVGDREGGASKTA